jgi:hypothetical protein
MLTIGIIFNFCGGKPMRQEPIERWKGLEKLNDIPKRPLNSLPEDSHLLANGFEKKDLESLLDKFYKFIEFRSKCPLPEKEEECLFNPFAAVLVRNNKTGETSWTLMYINNLTEKSKHDAIFNYGLFVGEYEKLADCTAIRFVLISDAFVAVPSKEEVEKGGIKSASEYPDRLSVLMLSFADLEGNIFEVLLIPYKIVQQSGKTDIIMCSDAGVLENKEGEKEEESSQLESVLIDVFVYGYCMNKVLGMKSSCEIVSRY